LDECQRRCCRRNDSCGRRRRERCRQQQHPQQWVCGAWGRERKEKKQSTRFISLSKSFPQFNASVVKSIAHLPQRMWTISGSAQEDRLLVWNRLPFG
jgi:hypothetical protein